MASKMNKCTRNESGFTLAETLLTTLILLMVSVIMATGIPAARDAYEKIVLASNAQVLLSTTINALRDELGTAWQPVVIDKVTVRYYSSNTGEYSQIYLDGDEIKIQTYDESSSPFYVERADGYVTPTPEKLVDEAMSDGKMTVTFSEVKPLDEHPEVITFEGVTVKRRSTGRPLTVPVDVSIRTIFKSESE